MIGAKQWCLAGALLFLVQPCFSNTANISECIVKYFVSNCTEAYPFVANCHDVKICRSKDLDADKVSFTVFVDVTHSDFLIGPLLKNESKLLKFMLIAAYREQEKARRFFDKLFCRQISLDESTTAMSLTENDHYVELELETVFTVAEFNLLIQEYS